MNRLVVLVCLVVLTVFGCVAIPASLMVETRLAENEILLPEGNGPSGNETASGSLVAPEPAGLDPSGFGLVSWNIQKQIGAGWDEDLERLSRQADILLVQEALLTEKLRAMLNRRPYHWHLVTAFEIQRAKAGVLTAAHLASDFVHPLRAAEPLIRIPKTALVTRYPLSGSDRSLMVANLHMINFAPDQAAFFDQARRIYEVLTAHPGPMIVAGDFNTWNRQRLKIVEDMAARLDLEPVAFETGLPRTVFGFAVDRVYYRGLTARDARVLRVTSSDHNPLLVRFSIDIEG